MHITLLTLFPVFLTIPLFKALCRSFFYFLLSSMSTCLMTFEQFRFFVMKLIFSSFLEILCEIILFLDSMVLKCVVQYCEVTMHN